MSEQLYLSSSPHIHSGETTDKVMRAVIYSLLPACGVAIYFFGLPVFQVIPRVPLPVSIAVMYEFYPVLLWLEPTEAIGSI